MLQRRGEIVEDILLVGEVALAVPLFAKLAAAADVRHGHDKTVVEQHSVQRPEPRWIVHAVAAVAGDKRRIVAVALRSFAVDDIHRNLRSVLRLGELANHFSVIEFDRLVYDERRLLDVARLGVVFVRRRRLDERFHHEQDVVPFEMVQMTHRRKR
jgi:hypothetical protein